MISTEDKILRAATGVFAKRGVSGATTREIARRARVNEVTLFRHFRNKDELLRRVVACSGQRFEDVFADAPLRNAADFRRTVENYAKVYAQKLIANEEFVRTFMGELTRHLELCRRLFAEGGKPARQKFIAYLRAAKRRGLVRGGVDAAMSADALSAMILGGVLRRPLTAAQYDIQRLREDLREALPERPAALSPALAIPLRPGMSPWAQRAAREGWLKWAIAISAAFAAILEVIDVSIVNVALPYMQGNLGATLSEIGWVSTGYSIANVIVIPLSAYLGVRYGKKRYFIFSLVAFTLASVMCGLADNLSMLIIGRVIQGLGGGGLLAKAQALMFETFPPQEQAKASMVFILGVIAGPAIGPALGGYLTDNFGWRWIFFINVPLGIMAVYMCTTFLLPDDPKEIKRVNVDWLGILFLSMSLGGLQTVLEQGQQDDWFSSTFIQEMALMSVVGTVLFIWQELRTEHPAVDLHVLRHRSLWAGSLLSLVVGMGLYGTVFVVPIFAQTVLQFTATKTGLMLVPGALASAVATFASRPLSRIFSPRQLIAMGSCMTIGLMISLTHLNPDTGADQLFWPLIWRGFASVLMFFPLSLAALGPIPKKDVASASGFFSLTRQLGGSIGIAGITTLVAKQQFVHRSQLVYDVSNLNPAFQPRLDANTSYFQTLSGDVSRVHQQALALLDQSINLQASLLSYRDVFYFVAAIFALSLPLILLLGKRPALAPAKP